jgi:hypothetical protein
MPIPKTLRKFYGATWRKETRPRILARAKFACEMCLKPHNTDVIVRSRDGMQYWVKVGGRVWRNCHGEIQVRPPVGGSEPRLIRNILTVAHLNHVSGDDRDDNLKALCCWCHLNFDRVHHKETRATRKDLGRPLLAVAAGAIRVAS